MHGKSQLEMLKRLPELIEEYEKIIEKYEGYNFKTKYINFLLEKYYGKKYGRKALLDSEAGINENHLKNIRNPYIKQTEGTLFLFAFGLGITLEEAIILAGACNIVWYSDTAAAEAIFSTLLLLKDEKFKKKDVKTKVNEANVYYIKVAKEMLDWKSKKTEADARRKKKINNI